MSGTVRKAVFPVAGLGTRFLPATKCSPKEVLPLVDKPIIQYTVEEVAASGISQVVIVTAAGKRAVEDHFDRSWEIEQALRDKGDLETLRGARVVIGVDHGEDAMIIDRVAHDTLDLADEGRPSLVAEHGPAGGRLVGLNRSNDRSVDLAIASRIR